MTAESENRHEVQPSDIDASRHLFDAFGHYETEISAGYIIRMFQEIGEWRPFTNDEIEEFYSRSGHKGFSFNGLIIPVRERLADGRPYQVGGGYIVEKDDGKYEVTEEFIARAFQSSTQAGRVLKENVT
jgi:hypothetical protein